jgi:hypothetical protein
VQCCEKDKILRPDTLGRFLFTNKIKHIVNGSIKQEGKFKIHIEFTTAYAANNFVKNIYIWSNAVYRAFIPTFCVTRMGLIKGVTTEATEQEIKESIELSNPNVGAVLKIRRLNYRDRSEATPVWKPSRTIVITFEGQHLPDHVYIFYNSFAVQTYVYTTVQCFKCGKFGHTTNNCKSSSPKCINCSESHDSRECSVNDYKCLNCNGIHKATSASCPEFLRQKSIKNSMAMDNISFIQASKLHTRSNSYANVINNNPSATFSQETLSHQRRKFKFRKTFNPAKNDIQVPESLLFFPNGSVQSNSANGVALAGSSGSDRPYEYNTSISELSNFFHEDTNKFANNMINMMIEFFSTNKKYQDNVVPALSTLKSCLNVNGSQNQHN